jgi:hypothetical protein
MAKTYLYRYSVTGTGSFPFDMLRYDASWPASQEDASILHAGHPRPSGPGRPKPYTLTLHSHKLPTEGRWRSFGWHVQGDLNDVALARIDLS